MDAPQVTAEEIVGHLVRLGYEGQGGVKLRPEQFDRDLMASRNTLLAAQELCKQIGGLPPASEVTRWHWLRNLGAFDLDVGVDDTKASLQRSKDILAAVEEEIMTIDEEIFREETEVEENFSILHELCNTLNKQLLAIDSSLRAIDYKESLFAHYNCIIEEALKIISLSRKIISQNFETYALPLGPPDMPGALYGLIPIERLLKNERNPAHESYYQKRLREFTKNGNDNTIILVHDECRIVERRQDWHLQVLGELTEAISSAIQVVLMTWASGNLVLSETDRWLQNVEKSLSALNFNNKSVKSSILTLKEISSPESIAYLTAQINNQLDTFNPPKIDLEELIEETKEPSSLKKLAECREHLEGLSQRLAHLANQIK